MGSARNVATLALVYRELYNARHESARNLFDDLETCPGELSLLAMVGSQALTRLDWYALRVMDEQPVALAALVADMAEFDPLRSEALLHAWPPGQPLPDAPW